MIEVRQTREFERWLKGMADPRAAKRIAQRIVRLQAGLFGDVKFFDGIGELRIDYGTGYRVYFVKCGQVLIILLCGRRQVLAEARHQKGRRNGQGGLIYETQNKTFRPG